MTRIFVSYSRADRQFVDEFVPLLYRVYGKDSVWFDDDITGGETWWPLILNQIQNCELFVYLLSTEALTSPYCQAEFREALRLHKHLLPVIVRPKTQISDQIPEDLRVILRATQWVDLSRGFKDYQANASLYAAINRLLEHTPARVSEPLLSPEPVSKPEVPDKPMRRRLPVQSMIVRVIGLLLSIAALIVLLLATAAMVESLVRKPTVFSPTSTVIAAEPTVDLHVLAVATRDAGLTQTAALWTATPTLDVQQTIAVQLTALFIEDQTATSKAWTETPIPSETPTITPTNEPSITPTSEPTNIPAPIQTAQTRVQHNKDWQAFSQIINSVEMVLVPAGCFHQGNDPKATYADGSQYIQGIPDGGIQCFSQPFWIDRTEVTNQQYYGSGDNRPIVMITWAEANDFCARREARLPTEAEWEYAARGPDGLIYPWGNKFIPDNVVYKTNQAADVGSRPSGQSWVGAYDLSGNVWEWTSTLNKIYPYSATDGRENLEDKTTQRMLRGGSFNGLGLLDGQAQVRAASRFGITPPGGGDIFGFRCARSQ